MSLSTAHIVFDCADAPGLAAFWSAALERPVDPGSNPYFATVGRTGTPPLSVVYMFIAVPDERLGKNRLHVDLVAGDRTTEVTRLGGLGAQHVGDFDEYGTRWTTLADPEGNLFDVAED
jgi:hypothetical protein